MTALDSLAISLPILISIFGVVVAWQNYKLKKKDSDKHETQEDVEKAKKEAEREKENDLRLLAIEKDVQYIRLSIEKFDARISKNEQKQEEHEGRINKLEVACKQHKGGK